MTGSPIEGVLSKVPGWPVRDPLRDPQRTQKLSEPLRPVVLFLLPLNLSPGPNVVYRVFVSRLF